MFNAVEMTEKFAKEMIKQKVANFDGSETVLPTTMRFLVFENCETKINSIFEVAIDELFTKAGKFRQMIRVPLNDCVAVGCKIEIETIAKLF